MSYDIRSAKRADYDEIIIKITEYVLSPRYGEYQEAMNTARLAFIDSIGCGLLALNYPQCTKLIGPSVPGAELSSEHGGVKVMGTSYQLEPVRAAFNIGALIRWLDFNDTWLAAEWGHPSDNLGGIWAMAEYISRRNLHYGKSAIKIKSVLEAMIMAYEIQGVLALTNSFNRVGLDHVLLVRIASAAVTTALNGGTREEILAAVSNAWVDGSALRTYRHAPNAGSRKSWAAGDASSRGLLLGLAAKKGEMGYPSALSAKIWGFQDVSFKSNQLTLQQEFNSYVMENILFKVSFPAEFHAQTAVECAVKLYPQVKGRQADIKSIQIETQESAARIIDKTGELNNPADRDHCLQYMIAVPLIKGSLDAEDYEDEAAKNPLIDQLRDKMEVKENAQMSEEYLDPQKRAIGNSIQIIFNDGSSTDKVRIDYPIGHRKRREESIPLIYEKFNRNIARILPPNKCEKISALVKDQERLEQTDIQELSDLLALY